MLSHAASAFSALVAFPPASAVGRAFHRGVARHSRFGPAAGILAGLVGRVSLHGARRLEDPLHLPRLFRMFFIFAFWHGNQIATDPGYQRVARQPFDATEHTVTLLVKSEPKIDQLRSNQRFVALVSCIDNRPASFQVFAECSGEPFSYGDRIIARENSLFQPFQ